MFLYFEIGKEIFFELRKVILKKKQSQIAIQNYSKSQEREDLHRSSYWSLSYTSLLISKLLHLFYSCHGDGF